MVPLSIRLLLSCFGYWLANTALKWLVNASCWITANPFIIILILVLAFILALARYNQKAKQLQVAKQDLPRSATLVSRLCEDSTALKNTINTAMATITINYAKQAKTLQADSIHAASLSDDQLDAETTVFSQPTDSLSKRQRKEEINRQLTDYGRVMLDNEKLVTKSGFCDALVKDVREALLALVGWFPINRLKRGRAKKCSSELKEIPS